MVKSLTTQVKQCVQCNRWFGRRKPSGQLYGHDRWQQKVTCSNSCLSYRRWDRTREPVVDRFWRQVAKSKKSVCWPYLGATRDKKGYGGFHFKGKQMMRAHRMAWIFVNGPIDSGLVVAHRCDNKICCNPYHLQVSTVAENNADTFARNKSPRPTRDTGHHQTKYSSAYIQSLLADYENLPRTSRGKCKQGVVKRFAQSQNHTVGALFSLLKCARNAQ